MTQVCNKCLVEVEDRTSCPLCDTPFGEGKTISGLENKKYPDAPVKDYNQKSVAEQKNDLIELLTVSLVFMLLIVIITDLMINQSITWSKYPMLSIILAWIMVFIPLFFNKRYLIIGIGEIVSVITFLALLDLFINGNITWFFDIGLPIMLIVSVCIILVLGISSRLKHKGLNQLSIILFGAALLCLGLDLVITNYFFGRIYATWSIYVVVPATLIGIFFLYIHYRFISDEVWKNKIKAKFML